MVPEIRFISGAMKAATEDGFLTATDVAEYLVKKGMPFREAHGVTGSLVRYCIDRKKTLSELKTAEFRKHSKLIGADIFKHISVDASVSGKKSLGGTSKKMVLARIRAIKK